MRLIKEMERIRGDEGDGPWNLGEEWSYTGAEWSPPLEERRQSVHTDAQHGGNVVEIECGGSIYMLPFSR